MSLQLIAPDLPVSLLQGEVRVQLLATVCLGPIWGCIIIAMQLQLGENSLPVLTPGPELAACYANTSYNKIHTHIVDTDVVVRIFSPSVEVLAVPCQSQGYFISLTLANLVSTGACQPAHDLMITQHRSKVSMTVTS